MVVDTSAILAVLFEEDHGRWAAEQLNRHSGRLLMSTVNLAEALIRIQDRQPRLAARLEERLLNSGIRFVPPDAAQARLAAKARLKYPLNLGDCFAYALAAQQSTGLMAVDRDFRAVDLDVLLPSRRAE